MSNIDVTGIIETNPVQGQPTTASVRSNTAAIKTQLSTAKTELENLSGVTDQVAARSNIGAVIGTNVQAYDATLQSLSALGTAADKIPYTTAVDTWAETPLTSFARSVLDDANAGAARTTLELDSSSGSSYIGFLPAGTGAVQRTVQSKLREVVSVKDFGAVGDGVTDDTAAIGSLFAYCATVSRPAYFPAGTYRYAPSARVDVAVDWIGDSEELTIINCDTSSYTGEFFRLTGSYVARDFQLKTNGRTKQGTGIYISRTTETLFVGHANLIRVHVDGFDKNISVNNSYLLVLDQVRSQYGNEGLYCVPVDDAGDNGYITTHFHLGCIYANNVRNIFYEPVINSPNVLFIGGSCDSATGAVAQAQFTRIRNLHFSSFYIENANTIPGISLNDCHTTIDSLYLNNTGGLSLGTSNNRLTARRVRTTSATDVLTASGGGTQVVELDDCLWPASGNTLAAQTVLLRHTELNGRTHFNTVNTSDNSITLTSGSPGTVLTFVVPDNTEAAIVFDYSISVKDAGVTRQTEGGRVQVVAARVTTGTPTVAVTQFGTAQALAAGTLTTSFAASAAADGTVTVTCTATSSVGSPTVRYRSMGMVQSGAIAGA